MSTVGSTAKPWKSGEAHELCYCEPVRLDHPAVATIIGGGGGGMALERTTVDRLVPENCLGSVPFTLHSDASTLLLSTEAYAQAKRLQELVSPHHRRHSTGKRGKQGAQ